MSAAAGRLDRYLRAGASGGGRFRLAGLRTPRILFLCARHPYPPWRGDQLRAFHLIKALATRAKLRVLCFGDEPEPLAIPDVSLRTVSASLAGRAAGNLCRPALNLPLQVRAFLDARMRRAVDDEVSGWRPDVLHVTLSRMAPYMSGHPGVHVHLDFVDSMGLNMRERSRASGPFGRAVFGLEASLVGPYEARVAREADSVSVVAELDRSQPGLADARVIPNGVDPEAFPYREPAEREPVAIFFGNLGYFHNLAPASFLATEVLDRLRPAQPDARVLLAGARPSSAVRRLGRIPGVELAADPPEMAPMLHRAAAAVISMASGSGIKNKVLEAFCAGTPVVANPTAVDGVEGAVAGEHFVLADGADETARAIRGLFADPTRRMELAEAARELVLSSYTWERRADQLFEAYGLATGA